MPRNKRPSTSLPSGVITVMFTDIVDSTKLKGLMDGVTTARRDTQFRSGIKQPHDTIVLTCVKEAGGYKGNSTGDGYYFTFTDAEEAVLCALQIQDQLYVNPINTPLGPLQVRTGLHTGFAIPTGDDYITSTMDKAARVQSKAKPGQVLISKETYSLVAGKVRGIDFKEVGAFDLKGLGSEKLYQAFSAVQVAADLSRTITEPEKAAHAREQAQKELNVPAPSSVPIVEQSFGLPYEPFEKRYFHHKSLQERLLSFGVNINTDLQKEEVLDILRAKFAIDDVIVDAEFAGFQGVASHQLSVVSATGDHPQLPDYVYEARKEIARPGLNKAKAYLENWSAPIIDQGDRVTLQVGHLDSRAPDGRYDYWTTRAVLKTIPKLQQQLLAGTLRLRELARRMDVVLVVVTADNKLVLARRSDQVDNARGQWMASVGESIDPSLDLDIHRVPNPLEATRRCLGEYDELNLSSSDVGGAHLKVLLKCCTKTLAKLCSL